jgi:hypothetical protein
LVQAVKEDCSRTSQDAIHQDDEQGLKGLWKMWAGHTAPFFACRKVSLPQGHHAKRPDGPFAADDAK